MKQMKLNSGELVIDFSRVTGHARRVLSHNIQNCLFDMGFLWAKQDKSPDTSFKEQNLDAAKLCINAEDAPAPNCIEVHSHAAGATCSEGKTTVFDATTQADDFFTAVKQVRDEVKDSPEGQATKAVLDANPLMQLLKLIQQLDSQSGAKQSGYVKPQADAKASA